MLAVLAIFFLSLSIIILLSIWIFTCLISVVEKVYQAITDLKLERLESFIKRKHPRLNSHLITGKIKLLWHLEEIYLVPCPIPVKLRINNRAIVSSYLIHKKLDLMK